MAKQKKTTEPIQCTVTVPGTPEHAFAVFVDQFTDWWPREYTWSQDTLDAIAIEPRQDGRCFERGPNDFRCDWGRVVVWEPPHRIVFTWQISPARVPEPNPARASEVEVRFAEAGQSETRVELEHRNFDRHGQGSDDYRAAMASPQGWNYILGRFAAEASS